MPRKDIHKDGVKTRFSSTNQPASNGRRPNVFSKRIRENRASLDDIRALIASMMTYTAPEIDAILKDKDDKPTITELVYLNAIKADIKKGEITNHEKLSDRAFGRPTQTNVVEVVDIPDSAKDRLDKIFNDARKQPEKAAAKKAPQRRVAKKEVKED